MMNIFRRLCMSTPTRALSVRRTTLAAAALSLILVASFVLVPGKAHAESTHIHPTRIINSISGTNNCSAHNTHTVVIVTDYGSNVDCFSGSGSASVGLYNVTALDTGDYKLTFNWLDHNGASHIGSTRNPRTFLSASNAAANYFAGSGDIFKITSITLSSAPIELYDSCADPADTTSNSVFIATNIPGSAYYTDCFTNNFSGTVGLYGVYAIETGFYVVSFSWVDYSGATHYSTIDRFTLLAAGNAAPGGFAGATSIAKITSLSLSIN